MRNHVCGNLLSGNQRPDGQGSGGFTLIELLVVVAVIAILAAIAVPNFIEAQVRSKVSAVRADHRTIAMALEAYHADNNAYPEDYAEHRLAGGYGMGRLTTPIAYITTIPLDVFGGYLDEVSGRQIITYTLGTSPNDSPEVWILTSVGPNLEDETSPAFEYPGYSPEIFENPASGFHYIRYDPTNGTTSPGDIIRTSDGPQTL